MSVRNSLTVPVVVEINRSLSGLFERVEHNPFKESVAAGLGDFLKSLSLPGSPTVGLRFGDANRAISVRVHAELLFPSVELMQRLWLALMPLELHGWIDRRSPDSAPTGMDGWLVAYLASLETSQDAPAWDRLVDFLVRVVLEVIRQRPSCLVSLPQAVEYLRLGKDWFAIHDQEWAEFESDEALTNMKVFLESLLDLGVSLANREMLLLVFIAGKRMGRSIEDSLESAFLRLRSDRIEIRANPYALSSLVQWTPDSGPISVMAEQVDKELHEMFQNLAETVFDELGIRLPDITLGLTPEHDAETLTVRINDLPGAPVRLLGQGEILTNETPANAVQVDPSARTARIPVTGVLASVVSAEHRSSLEEAGLVTWDLPGYIVLAVVNEIRACAARLLSLEDVEYQIARLELSFPELVHAVCASYKIEDITRVLRHLVGAEISIRDLRLIFERLLEYDTIPVDAEALAVLDDRLPVAETARRRPGQTDRADHPEVQWPYYLRFVRSGLRETISAKASRRTNHLQVYLLGPMLRQLLMEKIAQSRVEKGEKTLEQAELNRILEVFRQMVASLPATAEWPVVLTSAEIRPFLSQLTALEFPRLRVYSHADFSPQLNLAPTDRLELSD